MDPGKGSKRRPGDEEAFKTNFEKIFGVENRRTAGRRYFKQVKREDGTYGMVEVADPPPPLPSDLRFDGTFVSPVDGSVIRNKHDLLGHNARNKVQQMLPGMEQDHATKKAELHDEAFGKKSKQKRIEDIKRAVDNPVVRKRDSIEQL